MNKADPGDGTTGEQSLTEWLLTRNDDGDATGVNIFRVGSLLVGTVLTTWSVGFAVVVRSVTAAFEELLAGVSTFSSSTIWALVSVPLRAIGGAWAGAAEFFETLGVLAGPSGLALGLVALWLWVVLQ